MEIDEELLYKINASPYNWRKKAEKLKFAADHLLPVAEVQLDKVHEIAVSEETDKLLELDPMIFDIVFALMGFSIECLLKGIIIRENPGYLSNGTMSRKLRTHDLTELADQVPIYFNNDERLFFRVATQYMREYKYPIPLKIEEQSKGILGGADLRIVFRELFEKLHPENSKWGNVDMDKN